VRYPGVSDLETILDRTTGTDSPSANKVLSGERIQQMSLLARQAVISADVRRYAIRLVVATHPDHEYAAAAAKRSVRYGASPRGLQALILGAKIRAILDNRVHVSRDDLRRMTLPVLRHRVLLNFEAQAEGLTPDDVITAILSEVPASDS
jgi:MoxR-like ATPase